MSDLNEKKTELQELDNDLRRLTTAVRQFDEFESSGKLMFLGLGTALMIGGILALAGCYFLTFYAEISIVFTFLVLLTSLVFLFFGMRLLTIFLKLRFTLRKTAQIIEEVKERKLELEREITMFAK